MRVLEDAAQSRGPSGLQIRKVITKALADGGAGNELTADPESPKSLRGFVR